MKTRDLIRLVSSASSTSPEANTNVTQPIPSWPESRSKSRGVLRRPYIGECLKASFRLCCAEGWGILLCAINHNIEDEAHPLRTSLDSLRAGRVLASFNDVLDE